MSLHNKSSDLDKPHPPPYQENYTYHDNNNSSFECCTRFGKMISSICCFPCNYWTTNLSQKDKTQKKINLFLLICLASMVISSWKYQAFLDDLPNTLGTIIQVLEDKEAECYNKIIISYNFTQEGNVFYGNYIPNDSCGETLEQYKTKYVIGSNVIVYWYPNDINDNSLYKPPLKNKGLLAAVILTTILSFIMIITDLVFNLAD